MGYFNATLVRIAISEVLRSEAEQNLSVGFREAVAGYSVLSDVLLLFWRIAKIREAVKQILLGSGDVF